MASICISKTHQEYDCRMKYYVSGRKLKFDKWCKPCNDRRVEDEQAKMVEERG